MQASDFDLAVRETTPQQELLAWVVVVIGIVLVAWRLYRSYYAGLPKSLQRAKADLRGAREDSALQQVYLTADEASDPDRISETIRALLDGDGVEQTRNRHALESIRYELASTWAPYIERVPVLVRRLAVLAILVTGFGGVAVSTDVLIGMLTASSAGLNPVQWPGLAIGQSLAVVERIGSLLGGFPPAELLYSLLVVVVLTLGEWLYTHYWVASLALIGGTVALAYLDRELAADEHSQWVDALPEPVQLARVGGLGVGVVWGLMLVGIAAGRLAGPAERGVTYGAAAAVGGLLGVIAVGAALLYRNRDAFPTLRVRWSDATMTQRAYLSVRAVSLGLAALVGPLVPIWGVVALTKAPRLLGALADASLAVQALVVLVVVGVVAVLAKQAADAWGDVRAALQISAARQQVRTAVLLGGVPIVVVAVTYTLVAGAVNSILLGIVAGIVAGIIARTALSAVTRTRYRLSLWERSAPVAQRAVIEGGPLETRDGTQEYLRINGSTELLHEDRETLVAAGTDVATALVDDGRAPTTLPEWHARFAMEFGITDSEETVLKLYERVRKHTFQPLREHGQRVPEDHIRQQVREQFGDVPDDVFETLLHREEFRRGNIRRGEEYVTLLNDPYV